MSVPVKALVLRLSGNSLISASLPVTVAMSFPDAASVASSGREKEKESRIERAAEGGREGEESIEIFSKVLL